MGRMNRPLQFEAALEIERAVRFFAEAVGNDPIEREARQLAADAADSLIRVLVRARKEAA